MALKTSVRNVSYTAPECANAKDPPVSPGGSFFTWDLWCWERPYGLREEIIMARDIRVRGLGLYLRMEFV